MGEKRDFLLYLKFSSVIILHEDSAEITAQTLSLNLEYGDCDAVIKLDMSHPSLPSPRSICEAKLKLFNVDYKKSSKDAIQYSFGIHVSFFFDKKALARNWGENYSSASSKKSSNNVYRLRFCDLALCDVWHHTLQMFSDKSSSA